MAEKYEVLKFTSHDGEEFYAWSSKVDPWEVTRRTKKVYQIDLLQMTEEEYFAVNPSMEADVFFSDAAKEEG